MTQQYPQQNYFYYSPTGSADNFNQNINSQQEELVDVTKKTTNRRDDTNSVYNQLYEATYIVRPGERIVHRASGRKNKNDILGLTLALLTKEKHLNGVKYSRDLDLFQGIQMNSHNGEFVLVLRTDGRIVAMSDEVENHLGKTMRSLYTQCVNIFECLNDTDGNRLQAILNRSTDLTLPEQRLVCTFRLPKGKRPSRAQEDIKTISIAGHFYSCNESSHEKLFIARCEALVSRTANGSSSSQTTTANNTSTSSMLKLTLNDDMSINTVSTNVKDILGYSRGEMIGNWLGKYLATNDLEKFESIRTRYFQQDQQQQLSNSVCDIFDIFTNNGDGRLTFLCQIRPVRERRSKIIKFSVIAQLIDPSIRSEYVKYVQNEFETAPKINKAEQVNLVPSSISKASEDPVVAAYSPSLTNGLLLSDVFDANEFNHQQQYSPINGSLSNFVAPVNVDDELWQSLFESDCTEYPATRTTATSPGGFQFWPTKSFEDALISCQSAKGINNVFDELFDEEFFGNGCY